MTNLSPVYSVFTNKNSADLSYPIGIISDIHFPKPNADPVPLYEMLSHIRFDVLGRNGDQFDGWAMMAYNLTMAQKCTLDLMNRKEEEEKTVIFDNDGNHNERQCPNSARKEAAKIGINAIPGFIINTPDGKRTLVLHGHQFDSKALNRTLSKIGAEEYDKIAENDAQGAAAAKRIVKNFLKIMAYERAYAKTAGNYNVDRIIIGHRHLPEIVQILASAEKLSSANKFLVRQALKAIPKTVPWLAENIPDSLVERKLRDLFNSKTFGKLKNGSDLAQKGHDLLDFLQTKPDTEWIKKIEIKNLKPRHYKPAKELRKKPKSVELFDGGSWIDGNTTYIVFDKNGQPHLKDWQEERKKLGLSDPMSEEELVKRHIEKYGGLHPKTIAQIEYYEKHIKGQLDEDSSEKHAKFKDPDDLWTVEMYRNGKVEVYPAKALDLNHAESEQRKRVAAL